MSGVVRAEGGHEALRLGPFLLEQTVGRGATSEVWRGAHIGRHAPVAVKVLTALKAREAAYADAFRGEIRASAGLDHRNIITIYDFGLVGVEADRASGGRLPAGSPFLIMELAEGGSLKGKAGRLPWAELREHLLSLLSALGHAHARGVLHRDIKPGNLLIGGTRPGLKLTDFGLAHVMERDGEEEDADIAGTPAYMAPEQFDGRWRDFGPATDLYAAGCTAWSLVTGTPPYGRESPLEVRRGHLYRPLSPMEPRVAVPVGLDTWMARLLEKDPAWRFQRAADAAAALRALGDPVLPPVPWPDDERGPDLTVRTSSRTSSRPSSSSFSSTSTSESGRAMRTTRPDGTTAETTLAFGADPDGWTYLDFNEAVGGADLSGPALATPPDRPPRGCPPALSARWPGGGSSAHDAEDDALRTSMMTMGLRLYGLRTIPLVNREWERDSLWRALYQVVTTRAPRAVALIGAAGSGKSRLAEWLCQQAHEIGGAVVLRASHSPQPTAADGIGAMISRFLRVGGLADRDALARIRGLLRNLGVDDPAFARALLALAAPGPEQGEEGLERVRLRSPAERYAVVARLVGLLAEERPVVLWLDDAIWDAESLALVAWLLDARERPPVLILITAREESLSASSSSELARLLARVDVEGVGVGPLPERHRAELIRHLAPLQDDLLVRVADRTGGNPLFAVQLISDLVTREALEPGADGLRLRAIGEAELPEDLHAVWRERLAPLLRAAADGAQEAIELAAVLGHEVVGAEWESACALDKLDPPWALVGQLCDERLARAVGERGIREQWAFVHGMLRESLLRIALERPDGEARLARLHRVAADAISSEHMDGRVAERVARHRLASGDLDAAILPLLIAAKSRQQGADYAVAESLLDQRVAAMERLGVEGLDQRWEDGRLVRAVVYLYTGRIELAEQVYREILDLATERGSLGGEARALQGLGRALRMRGCFEEATPLLVQANALSTQLGDRDLRVQVLRELGRISVEQGRLDEAAAFYHQGFQIAWTLNDPERQGSCLRDLAILDLAAGRPEQAARSVEEARACFERCSYRWGLADAHNMIAEVNRRMGDLAGAEAGYRNSIRAFVDIGSWDEAIPRLNLGALLLDQGRRVESRRELDAARALMEHAGTHRLLAMALAMILRSCASERDPAVWASTWDALNTAVGAFVGGSEDLAELLERAGDQAWDSIMPDAAEQAWGLSRQMWQQLGRPERAAAVAIGRGAEPM